nr:unnamed protein product [Digitaria exilis]
MVGSPAPPPSISDSSAAAFKSNASGLSPGLEPTQAASASPAAAAPPSPQPVRVPSVTLVAVLGVVGELLARGFLTRLEIRDAERTDARAPALFDRVLATFLAEARDPEAASRYPIPPPPLGDGSEVELLRVLLAVRAHGGFAGVASWAAVAEAVGLDTAAGTAVKILYRKYLDLLDQTLAKPLEVHKEVESSGSNGGRSRRSGSGKDKFLSSLTKDLKRKRDPFVGMLNAVRQVAKNPAEAGMKNYDPRGYLNTAVWLRRHMFAAECLSAERLEGMLNWVRHAAVNPAEPGLIGTDDSDDHRSTADMLRREMRANNIGSASSQTYSRCI